MAADVTVELRAVITEFQAKMAEARGEMEAVRKKGETSFGSLSKLGSAGFLAVGAAAVAGVGVALKAANDLEDSHAALAQAVKNTGGSMDKFKVPLGAADKAMEKLGFTNAQTEQALAAGTTATGSSQKALGLLTTAADLAAYKHTDLATAMVAVAKGSEGNLRPLKQMGIDLPVVASSAEKVAQAQAKVNGDMAAAKDLVAKYGPGVEKIGNKHFPEYQKAMEKVRTDQGKLNDLTKSGSDVIDGLRQRMGGQAQAAADTWSGKLKVAKAQVTDLAAKLGEKLFPIIQTAIDFMTKHKTIVVDGIIAIGIAFGIMAGLAMAAFVAENLATLGIVAGLTLLIGTAIYVATHWHQVWTDIKHWFDDAVKFLRSGFGTIILAILGPIGWLAILALHWQQIWAVIKTATRDFVNFWVRVPGEIVSALSGLWNKITQPFKDAWGWVENNVLRPLSGWFIALPGNIVKWLSGVGGALSGIFSGAWGTVKKLFTDGINDVIRVINVFIGALDIIPGVNIKKIGLIGAAKPAGAGGGAAPLGGGGGMRRLATGGLVTDGPALIGEGNRRYPEFVIPTDPAHRRNAISLLSMLMGQITPMASGGILGMGLSALGDVAGVLKRVAGLVTGPVVAAAKAVMDAAFDHMPFPIKQLGRWVGDAIAAAVHAFTGGGGGGGNAGSAGSNAHWQALGQQMAAAYGWTGAEWVALNNVAMRESGWNPNAQNPTSSAWGIAQNIGGRAGYPDPSPAGQIAWMLAYIKSRYGDPIGAWQHELSAGWYDRGGILPPGLTLAMNTTGRNEYVGAGPGGVTVIVNVQGSVVSEGQLVDAVHTGLLRKQQRTPLGLR